MRVGVMRDSERYLIQAETVMKMAAGAASPAEQAVYLSIAEGWRKLAAEVQRNEPPFEQRSFKPAEKMLPDRDGYRGP